MPKFNTGSEPLDAFFYEHIADPQVAAPSGLSPEQTGFVRLTVETEQTAATASASPDFKRLWLQALTQAEEIQSGAALPDPAERAEVLPLSFSPEKKPDRRTSWPLALVAGLMLAVVAGMLVFLVIQAQDATTVRPSLANSPSAGQPTLPPTPTPVPSFSGLDLPYPGATSLVAPSDLWFRNYPASIEQNPTQFAFSTADKPAKILAYYRQKLAGQTDYTEDRPAEANQPYDGFVAFKGSAMLVINALDPANRDTFKNAPPYFKLFRQMSPNQTLLTITYGPVQPLPDMPDLSFSGSKNISNIDIKNWPDLFEPFGTYDTNVVIRPTLTTFATTTKYVQVVNVVKLKLVEEGYEILYDTYGGGSNNCEGDCVKNGWDIVVATRGSRTILVRIYGPAGRDAFQPAEISKLTAQGLNSGDTLVSYRTGLTWDYNNNAVPLPDMSTASVAMAPNASYLAVSKGNEVQIWKDGSTLSAILGNFQSPPYKMAWSPDAQTLAIASGTGIQFWSAQGGHLTTFAASHTARIKTLGWSPDGKTLASAAGCQTDSSPTCDERVLLWQPNGSLVAILPGHKGSPNAVLWSPDGQQLATEQNDSNPDNQGQVRIWDAQGKLIRTLGSAHPVNADNMAWLPSANSKILATGLLVPGQNQQIQLWDTTSGQIVKTLPTQNGSTSLSHLAWSPDGTVLAVTTGKDVDLFGYPGGQLLKTLTGHTDLVLALGWSPDGKLLATAGQDATIRLWDKQGNPMNVLVGSTTPYTTISWSPTSKQVLSINSDGNLWFTGGTDIRRDLGSGAGLSQDKFAWFPGSDNFVTYSSDGYLTTWNDQGYAITTLVP